MIRPIQVMKYQKKLVHGSFFKDQRPGNCFGTSSATAPDKDDVQSEGVKVIVIKH